MIRENLLYRIMSGIHIVFFTSLLCATIILGSGTILFLPAIAAIFPIGKQVLYKKININDSIVRSYLHQLRGKLSLLRYIPVNLVFLLNYVGFRYATSQEMNLLAILCIASMAFLLVLMLFIAGYDEFMEEKGNIITALMAMFCKPPYLLLIYVAALLLVLYFNFYFLICFCVCGTFFIMALEMLIFMQFLFFKKLFHIEDEDTKEFAYLCNQSIGDKIKK